MDLHALGANSPSERVSANFLTEGLLNAREKSWVSAIELCKQLKTGMTESEAHHFALDFFTSLGVTKHWHRPYICFGPGTALTFNDSLQKEYRLKEGDPVYFDFGPVWKSETGGIEYEGDIGDSYVFGENAIAEKCNAACRQLFNEAQEKWRTSKANGPELYRFLETRAKELGYELTPKVEGHRLSDYPHSKYSKERLSQVKFTPTPALWVLEVHIVDRKNNIGAFYEDILL